MSDVTKFGRRRFLAATGLGAASLPLLHADRAWACRQEGPRRFMMIIFPNGAPRGTWFPTRMGTDFDMPASMRPLESVRAKMIAFDGVVNQGAQDTDNPSGHMGYSSMVSGMRPFRHTPNGHTSIAGGISIDQFIADRVAAQVKTPRKYLYLGALCNNGSSAAISSWAGAQKAISPDEDGYRLFDELFANARPTGPDLATDKEMLRLRLARKSVFDHVTTDLQRFHARLGQDDREKLNFHMQSVRELEQRLGASASTNGCGATPVLAKQINFKNSAGMNTILPAQLDIAVGALAADVTRVVNLTIGDGWADMHTFPFLGRDHVGTGQRGGPGGGDPGGWHAHSHKGGAAHVAVVQFLCTEIAKALKKMDSIKEGNRTLLDNTAVLLMSSQETGGHNTKRIPTVLFGSCGDRFKTGRAMNMGGKPLNGLYVAVAQAMGLDVQQFGAYPGVWSGLS